MSEEEENLRPWTDEDENLVQLMTLAAIMKTVVAAVAASRRDKDDAEKVLDAMRLKVEKFVETSSKVYGSNREQAQNAARKLVDGIFAGITFRDKNK